MTAGQTLQYTAYPADAEGNDLLGTDMFGNPMPDASATYAYSGTDTRGNALGPVACPAGLCGGTDPKTGSTHAGDFHVVATDSALARASAPSFLQIRAGAPTQLALQPAKAQIASGSSVAYLVYDEDQYGNPILGTGGTPAPDIHEKVAFSGPTSGTCALDTHTGTYGCSPTKAGTYAIAASSSVPPPVGLTPAGAQLTVLPGGLWTVVIQPGSTNAAVGQGVSYTTLGYDQNNNLIGNITGSTRFTFAPTSAGTCVSPAGQPAVPGNDLCTANQAGTFYVVGAATLDNVTRSATAILKAS
jgi:hypothetical protein